MNRLKFSLVLILLFSILSVHAEEASHGEKKEEPAAEGEVGKKAEGPESKESQQPWIPIEAKIQELSARIRSKQESLEKLLEEKNHMAANSPQVREVLKEIIKEHAELKHLAEDYQKNINQLNYRFPERNAKAHRSYDRIEVKSIDEMEQAMGVDGKLNRNMKKMRSQYKSNLPKAADKNSEAERPANKKIDENKPRSIEEEDSIIINK